MKKQPAIAPLRLGPSQPPRNPVALAARQRLAGSHRASVKADRQRARAEVRAQCAPLLRAGNRPK